VKFSIVTCTWNSARFLPEAVRSVLAQDHPDIEYIFVDGGSTDGTLDIIKAIGRPVRLLENVRGGIARAMNAGIAAASGDVIAHLHSDDYYLHERVLSRVARALEDGKAEWAFGRCLSDVDGQRRAESDPVPRYSYRRLLQGNFIPHPATFVRRRLFERVGDFDPSIKYAMDYDLWLRIGKIAEPVQLDEHLAVFRRHPGSLSTSNPLATLQEDLSVRMRHASATPWSRASCWAYYLVRRRRLLRGVARGAAQ
jgi:glycosyltransferase involved in cell wall biosynthesis